MSEQTCFRQLTPDHFIASCLNMVMPFACIGPKYNFVCIVPGTVPSQLVGACQWAKQMPRQPNAQVCTTLEQFTCTETNYIVFYASIVAAYT